MEHRLEKPRYIDVLSDSTGETAEKVVRAALLQFPQAGAQIRLHTRVRTQGGRPAGRPERCAREGASSSSPSSAPSCASSSTG